MKLDKSQYNNVWKNFKMYDNLKFLFLIFLIWKTKNNLKMKWMYILNKYRLKVNINYEWAWLNI